MTYLALLFVFAVGFGMAIGFFKVLVVAPIVITFVDAFFDHPIVLAIFGIGICSATVWWVRKRVGEVLWPAFCLLIGLSLIVIAVAALRNQPDWTGTDDWRPVVSPFANEKVPTFVQQQADRDCKNAGFRYWSEKTGHCSY